MPWSQSIESRDNWGEEALEHQPVSTSIVDKSVKFWDSQKKNNFLYFKDVGAVVKTKVNSQLVVIKQERKLLPKLLVVAKSRPEVDVRDAIGEYEFNNTPPSNLHPDGSMIMLPGKSHVVHLVTDLPLPLNIDTATPEEDNTTAPILVLIIDAMCVVNMIEKKSEKFNGADFAREFISIIETMSEPYNEARIALDQYLPGSLKEVTRYKRTKKSTSIHYHNNDSTENRSLKSFLSPKETKVKLTEYLAGKVMHHYQGHPKKILVMHRTTNYASQLFTV